MNGRSSGPKAALVMRHAAHLAIRAYQLSLSGLVGRQCRHVPSCSTFADEAIGKFGIWAGGWMALARLSRCRPGGSSGFDPVPDALPPDARWYAPWRHGRWTAASMERGRDA